MVGVRGEMGMGPSVIISNAATLPSVCIVLSDDKNTFESPLQRECVMISVEEDATILSSQRRPSVVVCNLSKVDVYRADCNGRRLVSH